MIKLSVYNKNLMDETEKCRRKTTSNSSLKNRYEICFKEWGLSKSGKSKTEMKTFMRGCNCVKLVGNNFQNLSKNISIDILKIVDIFWSLNF